MQNLRLNSSTEYRIQSLEMDYKGEIRSHKLHKFWPELETIHKEREERQIIREETFTLTHWHVDEKTTIVCTEPNFYLTVIFLIKKNKKLRHICTTFWKECLYAGIAKFFEWKYL